MWNILIIFLILVIPFIKADLDCGTGTMTRFNTDSFARRSTVGMMIDAGSSGTRMHIYRWNKRVGTTPNPGMSIPSTEEKWTSKERPGVASFADNPIQVISQLSPLIEYAKGQLLHHKDDWCLFPIYFRATGGMREMPLIKRDMMMIEIRRFLSGEKNPFYFENEFARVISGEEEAVFAWAGANLLMGNILNPLQEEFSLSDVAYDADMKTHGVLDLGGASTQIAFYVPNQLITEGLFKLQIGGRKHWNLYTKVSLNLTMRHSNPLRTLIPLKSFLQFGHESAKSRYFEGITSAALTAQANMNFTSAFTARASCFHAGFSEKYTNVEMSRSMFVRGPVEPSSLQMDECMSAILPLLKLELDNFCSWVYDGECGIAGQYQPLLPPNDEMSFMGLSSYNKPWSFFQLPATASIKQFADRVREVCGMTFSELMDFASSREGRSEDTKASDLPYLCFFGSYIVVLLHHGYGFEMNRTLTVLKEYNGNSVGWPLGAILYEINAMPWVYEPPLIASTEMQMLLHISVGIVIGAILTWIIMRHLGDSDDAHKIGDGKDGETQMEDTSFVPHWSSRIKQYFPSFGHRNSYESVPDLPMPLE